MHASCKHQGYCPCNGHATCGAGTPVRCHEARNVRFSLEQAPRYRLTSDFSSALFGLPPRSRGLRRSRFQAGSLKDEGFAQESNHHAVPTYQPPPPPQTAPDRNFSCTDAVYRRKHLAEDGLKHDLLSAHNQLFPVLANAQSPPPQRSAWPHGVHLTNQTRCHSEEVRLGCMPTLDYLLQPRSASEMAPHHLR
ncbi:hypothetical protein LY78DRAFT_488618 [Colletotrichum sublineola]|nr:hypothetical protein LY78DRAFT_488618 [Colletotrichum sublineola]